MRHTKIVATIGPATESEQTLRALFRAGVNVARLNFSHGSHESHGRKIQLIRRIAQELDQPVAILQDLAGPKIRTGPMQDGAITLQAGQTFILTNKPVVGTPEAVSVTYEKLPHEVNPGDTILLNDGALELHVNDTTETDIVCEVMVGGELSSHKGINLPSGSITAPILTDKDRDDLIFGIDHGVDFIGLSFVRTAADVAAVNSFMAEHNSNIPLIAKIEKHEALVNISEIADAVYGLMIARGDLGVETPIERIPQAQKMLTRHANKAGIPVITATQMLKSMVNNPRPTRAEVTDIANAVLDGSDAIMLSEETAVGAYPLEAVKMMDRVIRATEEIFPFREWTRKFGQADHQSEQEAVAHAACQLAEDTAAAAIITCTQSGSTTRKVAKYRPFQPIIALTPDANIYRRLALSWGTVPLITAPVETADAIEKQALAAVQQRKILKDGCKVVITAGFPLHQTGTTNLIKLATVESAE